jgi:hypothetical protein
VKTANTKIMKPIRANKPSSILLALLDILTDSDKLVSSSDSSIVIVEAIFPIILSLIFFLASG